MGDLPCAKHCCCATGASNSIDQQQNANANNAGISTSMDESCQVLWHSNFWLHCMANVVANVLSSVYFPCQPSCQCTALQCNSVHFYSLCFGCIGFRWSAMQSKSTHHCMVCARHVSIILWLCGFQCRPHASCASCLNTATWMPLWGWWQNWITKWCEIAPPSHLDYDFPIPCVRLYCCNICGVASRCWCIKLGIVSRWASCCVKLLDARCCTRC